MSTRICSQWATGTFTRIGSDCLPEQPLNWLLTIQTEKTTKNTKLLTQHWDTCRSAVRMVIQFFSVFKAQYSLILK